LPVAACQCPGRARAATVKALRCPWPGPTVWHRRDHRSRSRSLTERQPATVTVRGRAGMAPLAGGGSRVTGSVRLSGTGRNDHDHDFKPGPPRPGPPPGLEIMIMIASASDAQAARRRSGHGPLGRRRTAGTARAPAGADRSAAAAASASCSGNIGEY
jgi:hypothetical protein